MFQIVELSIVYMFTTLYHKTHDNRTMLDEYDVSKQKNYIHEAKRFKSNKQQQIYIALNMQQQKRADIMIYNGVQFNMKQYET